MLTESKLDDADNELIENEFKNIGFTCYIKNIKSLSVKISGGIIVGIKDDIKTYVHQVRSESNFSL